MCNFNIYNFIITTVSTIAATIIAILFYFEFVVNIAPVITAFAIISAALFVIMLILLFLPCFSNKTLTKCVCKFGNTVIFASVASIIAVIAANAVTLIAGSVISALIVFFNVLFVVIALLGFIFLINCIICAKCARYCENTCNVNDNCKDKIRFMD